MENTARINLTIRFRAKSAQLRRISYGVLGLITLLLILGIGLFALAEELTRWKSAKAEMELHTRLSDNLKALEPYMTKHAPLIETLFQGMGESLGTYQSILKQMRASAEAESLESSMKEISQSTTDFLQRLDEKLEAAAKAHDTEVSEEERKNRRQAMTDLLLMSKEIGADSVELLVGLRSMLADMKAAAGNVSQAATSMNETFTHSSSLLSTYNQYVQKRIESLSHSRQVITQDIITSAVTRVGALLILFFLVQILVNLYRYNTRLAAFYDSRADALELSESNDQASFEKLVAALSPDTIDFGQAVKTPGDQLADLAKATISRKAD